MSEPTLASDPIRESVRKAYIEPIRTVLLLDDEYPTYGDEVSEDNGEAREDVGAAAALAKSIWKAYVDRGWLCDVEKDAGKGGDRISRSDLLVLDYMLDGQDPKPALDIVCELARSGYPNLVVVYTSKQTLDDVVLQIAAWIRGCSSGAEYLRQEGREDLIDTFEDSFDDEHSGLDSEILRLYLIGRGRQASKRAESILKLDGRALKGNLKFVVEAAITDGVNRAYRVPDSVPERKVAVAMSELKSKSPWVQSGNVFVAVVRKETDPTNSYGNQADRILQGLEDALVDWSPPLLRRVLAFGRSLVLRAGFEGEETAIFSAHRRAALLHYCLAAEDEHERTMRHKTVWRTLFDGVSSGMEDEVATYLADYSETDKSSPSGKALLEHVAKLSGSETVRSEAELIHGINAFLCSSPFELNHLTTGTVFQSNAEGHGKPETWICATPACDMEQRRHGSIYRWLHEMHPIRSFVAVRLSQIGYQGAKFTRSVLQADTGKYVFLDLESGLDTWRIHPTDESSVFSTELFLIDAETDVQQSGLFKAYRIVKGKGESALPIEVKEFDFVALAQLRKAYAERILHQVGHHLSRVGVDFISLPRSRK